MIQVRTARQPNTETVLLYGVLNNYVIIIVLDVNKNKKKDVDFSSVHI